MQVSQCEPLQVADIKRLVELQSLFSKVPGVLIYVWTIHVNLREFTFASTRIMHSSER